MFLVQKIYENAKPHPVLLDGTCDCSSVPVFTLCLNFERRHHKKDDLGEGAWTSEARARREEAEPFPG